MDLDESHILEALEEDDNTAVVAAYLEGIADGSRFLRVASSITKRKPVIVFKAGTTQAGARAVSSHTGTLAGSERAYVAAFRKCGILRAETVEELFQLSRGFAYRRPPGGDRVAIITNAGGPGIITSDAVERSGLHLASFKEETIGKLRAGLPPAANLYNPVDVLGDAREDRYDLALGAVLQDPGVDSAVVILTPQAMTKVRETAAVVARHASNTSKTVLAVFMGGKEAEEAEEILRSGGVPNFRFPEEAVRVLLRMREYARSKEEALSAPLEFAVDREKVRNILENLSSRGRKELVEVESNEILKAYGIPVARSILATNLEECIRAGRSIGYPVVAKIASPHILHKTDVGGVVVNITNTDELINAYERINANVRRLFPDAEIWGILVQEMLPPSKELIIGVNRDPQFGPLVMVGLGGIFVEVLKDVSFRLAPLAREEAWAMLQELKSYWLLKGVRGEPQSDMESAVEVILRVSQLACDFPQIAEMDINPLRVMEKGRGCMAVDARFVLQY
jgi:acetyltransferase